VATKKRLDVDTFFSEVDQTAEIYQLRSRIAELEKQLELEPAADLSAELSSQMNAFRQSLATEQGGSVAYPVAEIKPNPDQPRQTFPEEVEAMVLSLEREGQLDPIILFPDGTIFDGECRWRAATILKRETLDAVFTSRPDNMGQLRRKAYLTSSHRHSLNALDKAEALVAIACDAIPNLPPEEVPRIVNRVLTRWKRKKQSLGEKLHLQPSTEQEAAIAQMEMESQEAELFLLLLGLQEHPASLNRNVFSTLNLAPDLKKAIRERKLGCAQAQILNRLSANDLGITEKQALKLRERGIKEVTGSHLSISQTQQWVNRERAKHVSVTTGNKRQVKSAIASIRQLDVQSQEPEELQELQNILEEVLEQIRQKMNN
jgi:ParB family transcriptional regulator, chromosome partitioning protein